jgi:hypothetical protein
MGLRTMTNSLRGRHLNHKATSTSPVKVSFYINKILFPAVKNVKSINTDQHIVNVRSSIKQIYQCLFSTTSIFFRGSKQTLMYIYPLLTSTH